MSKITIALLGNPNCGKTTLFNFFTGSKQRVGNWPGVTVDHKCGNFTHKNNEIEIIDLPGIYSFSAYSLDEKVSRDFIIKNKPDVIVNILDATNLERNLYLTTQLLEMKVPTIVVLNMMDVAKQKKIKIEIEHLSEHLGCPVLPIIATKKDGFSELKDAIIQQANEKRISTTKVEYDSVVESAIERLLPLIETTAEENNVDTRWLAIKLYENDKVGINVSNEAKEIIIEESNKIKKHTGDDVDIVIADGRYGFIHGLFRDVVHKNDEFRRTLSDAIDKVVLNNILGIPIFVLAMYLVFMLTINFGGAFIDFFDIISGAIFVDGLGSLLASFHAPQWLITLLADGVGGGIQTVATFIPPIFFMFLSLSFLEDSGYMSRAAFVMDKFMRFIGLPGKAFIPMLVGFGCNVPAIMATRTLENKSDRYLTILLNPFMSCGARMPVYVLFTATLFPRSGGIIIFSLYMTGIVLAIISGLLFKKTLFKGKTSTFVMELPPYHIPTVNGVFLHTWLRLKEFIARAGKIIIFFVIILSFLSSVGADGTFNTDNKSNSILSVLGKKITPVFHSIGIKDENWPATVGLITGIFAKESISSTIDALYTQIEDSEEDNVTEQFNFWASVRDGFISIKDNLFASDEEDETGQTEFGKRIKKYYSTKADPTGKKAGFAYLLFVLIYIPCIATIGAIYNETNWKWTTFSVLYLTVLAWLVATLFYQFATFFDHPNYSLKMISVSLSVIFGFYLTLKLITKNKNFVEV